MNIEQKINYQLNKYPFIKKIMKCIYQRGMYVVSRKIKSEGNITRISPADNKHEYFFGYYDKSPWDISDRYMLCLKANNTWSDVSPKEKADILIIDTFKEKSSSERIKKIAETRAWNVQQSCMLQWLGPDFSSKVLYNDYRDGNYVSIILTLATMKEKVLPVAVYSVSADGRFALTLDFSRLYELRPGYGYYNVPEVTRGIKLPDTTAIWKVDLETGKVTELLKYTDFANFQPRMEMKENNSIHKVNHIMINPNGKRFMVLYRWFCGRRKYTRLITCNTDGTDMYVLSDDDMVSHCFWKNNNEIIAFENKKKEGVGYYLMKDKSNKYIHLWPELSEDGHPSFSPDGTMVVTDSYPNRTRISNIKVMSADLNKNSVNVIAKVYAPFKYDNDTRCDLHPRWNHGGDKICFDGVFEGHRGLYTVEMMGKDNTFINSKISVVIATYNGEKFLEKQLDSIVKQTLLPNEVIICDDISTDGTYEIACKFKEKYKNKINIIVYKNEEKLNFINNFLRGISHANGDFIFLSDQDDLWDRKKIEYMVKEMKRNSQILSLSCSYDLIDEDDRKIKSRYSVWQSYDGRVVKISWKKFIKSTNFPGMTMAIRRELIEKIKTVYNDIPAHDWLLNEEAARCGGMYKLNVLLTHYRQHGNNTIGTITNTEIAALYKNRKHSIDFFEKTHFYLLKKYQDDKKLISNIQNHIKIDENRRIVLKKKKLIECLLLYIFNTWWV